MVDIFSMLTIHSFAASKHNYVKKDLHRATIEFTLLYCTGNVKIVYCKQTIVYTKQ